MQKIGIPTDFSANAFNALRYASELFKYEQCDFFLLYTYAEEIHRVEAEISDEKLEALKELLTTKP